MSLVQRNDVGQIIRDVSFLAVLGGPGDDRDAGRNGATAGRINVIHRARHRTVEADLPVGASTAANIAGARGAARMFVPQRGISDRGRHHNSLQSHGSDLAHRFRAAVFDVGRYLSDSIGEIAKVTHLELPRALALTLT